MRIKERGKQLLFLQAAVMIYTLSGIMAKFAAKADSRQEMVIFWGLDLFFLGIYALIWQQLIKRLPLSVAYTNRSMALLWSAVWSIMLFKEGLSIKQLFAVGLVIAGTVVVNLEKEEK